MFLITVKSANALILTPDYVDMMNFGILELCKCKARVQATPQSS